MLPKIYTTNRLFTNHFFFGGRSGRLDPRRLGPRSLGCKPWLPIPGLLGPKKRVPGFQVPLQSATRNFALASGSERELSWGVPALSLPSAWGPLRGALRLQQAMCGASDTRERAHDARQRFLARIVRTREKATEKPQSRCAAFHVRNGIFKRETHKAWTLRSRARERKPEEIHIISVYSN